MTNSINNNHLGICDQFNDRWSWCHWRPTGIFSLCVNKKQDRGTFS